MARIRNGVILNSGDSSCKEDIATNSAGSGEIAMPEPVIKWKDDEELLKRYTLEGSKSLKEFLKK